jgi:predicted nucleic acid-binding protein
MSCMSDDLLPLSFIDTNIWLYAFIEDQSSDKTKRARDLINACQPVLSVQVINEVCVNLIKKANFTEEQIRLLIDAFFEKYPIINIEQEILSAASNLRQRYVLSFWDSLVVACALQIQVSVLYSEDLQHEQVFEGQVKIINPFI